MHVCRICSKKFPIGCTCALVEKKPTRRKKKKEDSNAQTRIVWSGSPREQLKHWKNRRSDGSSKSVPQSSQDHSLKDGVGENH